MNDILEGERAHHAAQLASRLAEVRALREGAAGDEVRATRRRSLRQWQADRLARTYADLLSSPRYKGAATFFLSDLYGATDFSARDADLARILPLMARVLPLGGLKTVALAVEVDALSERLDAAMVDALGAALERGIDEASYAAAYRDVGRREERQRQLELIRSTGEALDALSRKSLVRVSIRMMHGPAHLAGVGALHDFLERGFEAFHAMGPADEFLDTVLGREQAILRALFAGDPAPFAV
jgi:hypothetical protein